MTWNSACGPLWDADWPTGAGPSNTKSDANLPSNAIVSFELVKKVDGWGWFAVRCWWAITFGLGACLDGVRALAQT